MNLLFWERIIQVLRILQYTVCTNEKTFNTTQHCHSSDARTDCKEFSISTSEREIQLGVNQVYNENNLPVLSLQLQCGINRFKTKSTSFFTGHIYCISCNKDSL